MGLKKLLVLTGLISIGAFIASFYLAQQKSWTVAATMQCESPDILLSSYRLTVPDDKILRFDGVTDQPLDQPTGFIPATACLGQFGVVLDNPLKMEYSPVDGYLYVVWSDSSGSIDGGLVAQFDTSEAEVKCVGIAVTSSSCDGPDCIESPEGIVFGSDGMMYIADHGSKKLFKYNPESAELSLLLDDNSFGYNSAIEIGTGPDGEGEWLYFVDMGSEELYRCDPASRESCTATYESYTNTLKADCMAANSAGGSSCSPRGMKFGPDGKLYVSSFNKGVVLRYQGPDGVQPGKFDGVYVGAQAVNSRPVGIEFHPHTNKLYVALYNSEGLARFQGPFDAAPGLLEYAEYNTGSAKDLEFKLDPLCGDDVSEEDPSEPEVLPAELAEIQVVKEVSLAGQDQYRDDGIQVLYGERVDFRVTVLNQGGVDLHNLQLIESNPDLCLVPPTPWLELLRTGEEAVYYCSGVAADFVERFLNEVTVVSEEGATDKDEVYVDVLQGEVVGEIFIDRWDDGIRDRDDTPLINIDIIVTDSGQSQVVETDSDGNFMVDVIAGDVVIQIDQDDTDLPAGIELQDPVPIHVEPSPEVKGVSIPLPIESSSPAGNMLPSTGIVAGLLNYKLAILLVLCNLAYMSESGLLSFKRLDTVIHPWQHGTHRN